MKKGSGPSSAAEASSPSALAQTAAARRVEQVIRRRDEIRAVYDGIISRIGASGSQFSASDLINLRINVMSTFEAMAAQEYPGMEEYMLNLRHSYDRVLNQITVMQSTVEQQQRRVRAQRTQEWADDQAMALQSLSQNPLGPSEEPLLELEVSPGDIEDLEGAPGPIGGHADIPPVRSSRPMVRSEIHRVVNPSPAACAPSTGHSRRVAVSLRRSNTSVRGYQSIRGRRNASTSPPLLRPGPSSSSHQRVAIPQYHRLDTRFKIPKRKDQAKSMPVLNAGATPKRRSVSADTLGWPHTNPFRHLTLHDVATPSSRIVSVQRYAPEIHDATMSISTLPEALLEQQRAELLSAQGNGGEPPRQDMSVPAAEAPARRSVFERLGAEPSAPMQQDDEPLISISPPPQPAEHEEPDVEMGAVMDMPVAMLPDELMEANGSWPVFVWPPEPKRAPGKTKRHGEARELSAPYCLCCIMFNVFVVHKLPRCPHFLLFTVNERWRLIDWWFVCRHYWQYGHQRCGGGLRCDSVHCNDRHDNILCHHHPLADVISNRLNYRPNAALVGRVAPKRFSPYCLCCIAYRQYLPHNLWACDHFLALPVAERCQMVQKWRLCRVCAKYGHVACEGEPSCDRYELCMERHNSALCEYAVTADHEENIRRAAQARLVRFHVKRDGFHADW